MDRHKTRRYRRIKGLCVKCGAKLAPNSVQLCTECLSKIINPAGTNPIRKEVVMKNKQELLVRLIEIKSKLDPGNEEFFLINALIDDVENDWI